MVDREERAEYLIRQSGYFLHLSVCLSVCLSVSVYLSVGLTVSLLISISVCLSMSHGLSAYISTNYPFLISRISTNPFCIRIVHYDDRCTEISTHLLTDVQT